MSLSMLEVSDDPFEIQPANFPGPDCPARALLMRLADKWTTLVIRVLARRTAPIRFNQLRRTIGGISQKMLAQTLRELERDGLVTRTVFAEVPPRVEYAITSLGATLETPLEALHDWAQRYMHEVHSARECYLKANP